MPTTASPAKQATGAGIHTMMQLVPTEPCRVVEFGCSFDASAAAAPGIIELVDTGLIYATGLTAYNPADIKPINDPYALSQTASLTTTGTANASSATTLGVSGTPWTAHAFIGAVVVAGSSTGYITDNTNAQLTVDRWWGGTPATNAAFSIYQGYPFVLGTGLSGFAASAPTENSITVTRSILPPQLIAPTNQWVVQEPLGREGELMIGNAVRVRMNFAATVNALCYVDIEV